MPHPARPHCDADARDGENDFIGWSLLDQKESGQLGCLEIN